MRFSLSLLLAVGFALWGGPALAQEYPTKPIHIIVPFPPGGIATIFSRHIGDQLEARWKQPVVVEYKTGAGSFLGLDYVSRSAPDGYTLVISTDTASSFQLLVKGNTFDPEKELASISMIVRAPYVLQSPAALPVRTLREFIAYAKANPGKLNAGVVGNSVGQLGTILFMKRAGIDMAIIPYNGGAPNLAALLANEIQLYFGNYGTSAPHFKSGKLVPLAVTSAEHYFLAPELPTLKESGVAMDTGYWFGLFAPAGTPAPIIGKLGAAVAQIMKTPDTIEKMKGIGLESVGSTPEELTRALAAGAADQREAVRLGGVKPE